MPNTPLVSLCMIVKNEEECLPRALANWRDLADELIIVDTGSTDRTVEIAQAHDAAVLHYDWKVPGHKGEARNVGIDAAQGKWIVVLDADEVIRNPAGVRRSLQANKDADAINVQFINFAEDGSQSLAWYQIRIFRRGRLRYFYREHEFPKPIVDGTTVAVSDIVFEHRVPPGRQAGKSLPMMARLTLDVAENPGDPHPLYFLHRECVNQGEYHRGIQLGHEFLALAEPLGLVTGDCWANLAIAYQRLGDMLRARTSLYAAIGQEPTRREWWYRAAVLHADCQQWNLALAVLRAAAEIAPDQTRQWEPQTTALIYDLMGHCQHQIAHAMAHHHEHHH